MQQKLKGDGKDGIVSISKVNLILREAEYSISYQVVMMVRICSHCCQEI